jgi:ankyrin repeat protein
MVSIPAASSTAAELYKLAVDQNWNELLHRVTEKPEECKYIDSASKYSPLHVVVLGRESSNPSGRLSAVRSILSAYQDAAKVKNELDGLTPLHLACMVESDVNERLEEDHAVVRLILEQCPKAVNVLSREGYSPLDCHIIAMSKINRKGDISSFRRPKKGLKAGGATTAILKALLAQDIQSGMARPLDLLFECNSLSVLEQIALEEAQASSSKLRARRQARSNGADPTQVFPTGSTNFANFWVWEWAIIMLKSDHSRRNTQYNKPIPPFSAMHAAAQVKDCPVPFLMLTMRAFPSQVRAVDEATGNLPLHIVAGWETSDPSSISRKSMALSVLVSEYPHATKIRNKSGKTPLSLALETGTSWDNGVRRLTSFSRDPSFRVPTVTSR